MLDRFLSAEHRPAAVDALRSYFHTQIYTGRRFERLDGGGDRPGVADTITAADIAALPLLSIRLGRPKLVIEVLETHAETLGALLREIPRQADIRHVPQSMLAAGSPSDALYWELRQCDGVGPTVASKLLARKRPHLYPIDDDRLRRRLNRSRDLWACWWSWLQAPWRSEAAEQLREEVGGLECISVLRVMDVVVWMGADARP